MKPTIHLVQADDATGVAELRTLLQAYEEFVRTSVGGGYICLTSYAEELAHLAERYDAMLMARMGEQPAGCVLLRTIHPHPPERACEMKRLLGSGTVPVRRAWQAVNPGRDRTCGEPWICSHVSRHHPRRHAGCGPAVSGVRLRAGSPVQRQRWRWCRVLPPCAVAISSWQQLSSLLALFLLVLFFADDLLLRGFWPVLLSALGDGGMSAPERRASLKAMAMACFGFRTFSPLWPDVSSACLNSCIVSSIFFFTIRFDFGSDPEDDFFLTAMDSCSLTA